MHAQILVHYGSCRNPTQALGNVRTFSPEHELKLIENVLQAPPPEKLWLMMMLLE